MSDPIAPPPAEPAPPVSDTPLTRRPTPLLRLVMWGVLLGVVFEIVMCLGI